MEDITRKGRGRPRKAVAVPDAVAEGADASSLDTGDGQAGRVQPEARANDGREDQSGDSMLFISSEQLCDFVLSANSWNRRIIAVFHPEPHTDVFHTDKFGGIRIEKGEPGYQLQTGEIVTGLNS